MRMYFSYIPLLALIATIGCATPAGDRAKEAYIDQNTAKQIFIQGMDYAVQGKMKEAKEKFEKIVKVYPFYEPIKGYLKVIEDVSNKKIDRKAAIHLFKGITYANKKQHGMAINEYNNAIEIDPRYYKSYGYSGVAYYWKGQHDKAFSYFNKAIELSPRNAKTYSTRGYFYRKSGQYDRAISDYSKSVELNPMYAESYSNRGGIYIKLGKKELACEDFEKACKLGLCKMLNAAKLSGYCQ